MNSQVHFICSSHTPSITAYLATWWSQYGSNWPWALAIQNSSDSCAHLHHSCLVSDLGVADPGAWLDRMMHLTATYACAATPLDSDSVWCLTGTYHWAATATTLDHYAPWWPPPHLSQRRVMTHSGLTPQWSSWSHPWSSFSSAGTSNCEFMSWMLWCRWSPLTHRWACIHYKSCSQWSAC